MLPSGDGTIGLELRFTFASSTAGSFPAVVRFQETEVGRIQVGQLLAVVQLCTGVLQLLVLPAPQLAAVTSFVSRLGWNSYYEATLTQLAGQHCRHKTVYVYLTDKQIIVREFYLRLIPHRLVSYRVHPQVLITALSPLCRSVLCRCG